jgi:hypothetical protein
VQLLGVALFQRHQVINKDVRGHQGLTFVPPVRLVVCACGNSALVGPEESGGGSGMGANLACGSRRYAGGSQRVFRCWLESSTDMVPP